MNETIHVAKNHPLALEYPKLYISSFQVLGVAEASLATNADFISPLGYILFLSDRSGAVLSIGFMSFKARRVTRWAVAAELIAFTDMFDVTYTLSNKIGSLLICSPLSFCLLTDSESLLDIIHER